MAPWLIAAAHLARGLISVARCIRVAQSGDLFFFFCEFVAKRFAQLARISMHRWAFLVVKGATFLPVVNELSMRALGGSRTKLLWL